MRQRNVFVLLATMGLLTGALPATGETSGVSWGVTGSGKTYHVEGAGNPLSDDGARVLLTSHGGYEHKFGASYLRLDAQAFRNRSVTLSADLATRDAVRGAGLWLRADDESGKVVAFRNSQDAPVIGDASARREVQIDVPPSARTLVLGTLLDADGEVLATHLHLGIGDLASVAVDVTAKQLLDAAIDIVRANALNARTLDWDKVEPQVREMARGATSPVEAHPAIRQLLASLGDRHSMLIETRMVASSKTTGAPTAPVDISASPAGIGYVSMPGYLGMDPKAGAAFADDVIARISRTATSVHCGWILDLRSDGGGNMWPMLAALKPFLGDGNLGGFERVFGRSAAWRAGDNVDALKNVGPDLAGSAVAVLIGPRTASAGEAVTIAFRGRPATRTFGEPTAGLTNGNAVFPLPDGSMIALASVVELDRNDHAYTGKIYPDIVVMETDEPNGAVAAASDWLQQNCSS